MTVNLTLVNADTPTAHWHEIAALYGQFAREEGAPISIDAQALQRAISQNNAGYHLAVVGDFAGLVAWTDHPARALEILDLFILPTSRRRGLAGAAIGCVIQRAVATHACVDVAAANVAAQSLYHALGFQTLSARLVFCPLSQLPTTMSGHTPKPKNVPLYYDVESNQWLPAAWPKVITGESQLDQAIQSGGDRFWVGFDSPRFGDWPRHPNAVRMQWQK